VRYSERERTVVHCNKRYFTSCHFQDCKALFFKSLLMQAALAYILYLYLYSVLLCSQLTVSNTTRASVSSIADNTECIKIINQSIDTTVLVVAFDYRNCGAIVYYPLLLSCHKFVNRINEYISRTGETLTRHCCEFVLRAKEG